MVLGLHLQPKPTRGKPGGAAWGEQGLMPTLAFSMRMLVLWPLVPSVLWPLPALRMLPILPSLPTLFLSPAAWGRRGGHQQRPRIRADTGHRGPWQGPVCQHSDAGKKQPPIRSLRPQTMCWSLPPPSMHDRKSDLGWQGMHEGDMRMQPGRGHTEGRGCSTGSPKLPFPAPAPSRLAVSPPGGGRRVSPCVPLHRQDWEQGEVPSPSPSPAAPLT